MITCITFLHYSILSLSVSASIWLLLFFFFLYFVVVDPVKNVTGEILIILSLCLLDVVQSFPLLSYCIVSPIYISPICNVEHMIFL